MNEYPKRWLLALALAFFACFPASSPAATLSAPERAEAGRLQVVKSDIQGDWLVYPPDSADIAKDSDGLTLYFVARKEGTLTVIFFGVENTKPVISQTSILIGPEPDPDPTPEPSPSPVPKIKLTDREKTAAKAALEVVINGVENGTIKTPAGARSTFRQTLQAKGTVCDGRQCYIPQNLQDLADKWTERTDFSSVESVKTSFQGFLQEVE